MGNVVDTLIDRVYRDALDNHDGEVAGYIPELAAVPADSFGICIATVDGYVYERGDTRSPFTIQSISKPFTYALALADRGRVAVGEKIDVEPSGEPFNEISLDPQTERPRNPMINAGAITAASLVAGADPADRFRRIRAAYSAYAGRELDFNKAVYASEARTGHRNRAIGHMLRSFDIITEDPDDAVDLYFRQCSIDVTCRDLSLMAATLANNGVNPVTSATVLDSDLVEQVLSVMATCGMYDAAGEWLADVGLPAKSGVGGGIVAVLPGQIGIAVYSPRLDRHGNSVRGVQACRALSRELELHFLHVTRASRSSVRARYTVAEAPSRMRRPAAERALLDEVGYHSRVYELHGDLLFAGAEAAVREMANAESFLEAVVIDVRRVDDVGDVAATMLAAARSDLAAQGCGVALVDPDGLLGESASDLTGRGGRVFVDLDSALQWCEDVLLELHGPEADARQQIALSEHPMLAALGEPQRTLLEEVLDTVRFHRDDCIAARGTPPSGLFLILSGRVSSTVTDAHGVVHRIMTLSAGMSFGEMPLILRTPWLHDMRADTEVTAAVLSPQVYDDIAAHRPDLEVALLQRLAAGAYEQLDLALRSVVRSGVGPLR
ncbi:glutaminase A [Rhodococcus triatomae]|uniref:Glutaminase n=1 Tax=Rhodococcus triatomae TaxID=300028 RepID=A0A1G8MN46_9NOCA|nr:glutaminase A [Rhodococcus triatomae]QNG19040.1 glutaminase A [Rhodococcus triatomae]QNG25047.1 glutaminase A [Rhodococcus triatomae]SDI69312.1 L-glutaminase [Rhodococcus triatomae]